MIISLPNNGGNFDVCIYGLNETVIDNDNVCINCEFNCDCNHLKDSKYFIYKKDNKKGITNQDLIDCLIINKFIPCKWHFYLKYFRFDSPTQVTPIFDNNPF